MCQQQLNLFGACVMNWSGQEHVKGLHMTEWKRLPKGNGLILLCCKLVNRYCYRLIIYDSNIVTHLSFGSYKASLRREKEGDKLYQK